MEFKPTDRMNSLHDNECAARWRRTQLRRYRAAHLITGALALTGMIWTGPKAGQAIAWWIDGSARAAGSATLWLAAFLLLSACLFFAAVRYPESEDFEN